MPFSIRLVLPIWMDYSTTCQQPRRLRDTSYAIWQYVLYISYIPSVLSKHKDCVYVYIYIHIFLLYAIYIYIIYHSKLPFTWPGHAADVATNWDTQTAEGGPSVTCGDGHASQSNNKDSLIRTHWHSGEQGRVDKITATIWYLICCE